MHAPVAWDGHQVSVCLELCVHDNLLDVLATVLPNANQPVSIADSNQRVQGLHLATLGHLVQERM
jgi:hypothetical protein